MTAIIGSADLWLIAKKMIDLRESFNSNWLPYWFYQIWLQILSTQTAVSTKTHNNSWRWSYAKFTRKQGTHWRNEHVWFVRQWRSLWTGTHIHISEYIWISKLDFEGINEMEKGLNRFGPHMQQLLRHCCWDIVNRPRLLRSSMKRSSRRDPQSTSLYNRAQVSTHCWPMRRRKTSRRTDNDGFLPMSLTTQWVPSRERCFGKLNRDLRLTKRFMHLLLTFDN